MTDQYDPNGYNSYGSQPGGANQGPGSGQGGQPSGSFGGYSGGQQYPQPGYGQPGSPSQPYTGGASQPTYAQQTVFTQLPAPKKSRRGLKIALILAAVILALGAVGGAGAIFFINQFAAPGTAALQFCDALKTQKFDNAYKLLSSDLQAKYSQDSFRLGVSALDTAEGRVTDCQRSKDGNSYVYSLGASTATVTADLTRATQGTLTGSLHMKNQNGSWKVDGIDTSLLGVNIGALQASGAFCAAMQSQNYSAAYDLLDSAQQGLVSRDDFVASGKLHDTIDGAITKCTLAKVPQGNTDQLTHLTIDLNRSKLGDRTGDVTLKVEGSAWKLDATEASLNGTDLRPLVLGSQFCVLFEAGKYGDAYSLLSSTAQASFTKAEFISSYATISGYTVKWSCGTADISTYKVSTDTASIVVPITASISALNFKDTLKTKVEFVLENGAWKIDRLVTTA